MSLQNITYTDKKDTRSGFGVGIYEAGKENPNVVALCADLIGSLKLEKFIENFPERFVQTGIAEANMIGIAAGLTIGGKIPVATTFANFGTGRVYDQIRQSVAYSDKNVKICCSHAGLTLGEDGATHQILEDIGLMKMLPHMTVVVPCDYNQTRLATKAIIERHGPTYLRFGRPVWPIFTPAEDETFQIGKAQFLSQGSDVTIIACGHLVWHAVLAGQELEKRGISVELINMHTIKPLDVDAILQSVKKTGCVVTAEEHQMAGGLGESVASVLSQQYLAPLEMVAVKDTFGESGTPDQLLEKYGLMPNDIIKAVEKVISRK
ncbi:MAG TPA: transketolase C-terminal domain-containing protein [Chitinophagales bacterium]|nr:transketolase C-terminal domain-containing protein [Chitinophagales bacterium]HMZ34343.1 transketolase C-terminal domain-containing protein [Chitinophagales bacterium]HNK74667.1 transketolase C-terminal domain-containing protein [Chitinophagales bacterium]HNN26285.1 transketolase C-terminal domain-containing protein [Chitinophagales bacterium]HNO02819.1 transketolase C-terminal domain-containing protein [Chitinophagales bacterium]